ncbi:GAF domain-containing protein [Acidovorax sp. CCYZU-2555]|uniref:GAF domain-containing protein n=1 Tax=Acidovorax sp. CCYZU-2555 TaxID=2835042 RepID=UPI001BD0B4A2|nr:GAF domain-containing protein [Acidovorax sp. CCYZU-2555]MBS7776394.1 GAF domain-containing protein [Acidovorax sp. CCYZU-2555]
MKQQLEELRSHLEQFGLLGGLEFLNHRVGHRFTSIYRFHDMSMNVQAMYDKQNERTANPFARVPIANSFCEMAMHDGFFLTKNTKSDARLDSNPFVEHLGSYVGLPLEGPQGGLYGTICHYDLISQPISDEEFSFLQKASLLLPSYLPKATAPV